MYVGCRMYGCMSPGKFHDGITFKRLEVLSWNFVWCLILMICFGNEPIEKIGPPQPPYPLPNPCDGLTSTIFVQFWWICYGSHFWRDTHKMSQGCGWGNFQTTPTTLPNHGALSWLSAWEMSQRKKLDRSKHPTLVPNGCNGITFTIFVWFR